jgi:hypothetical protein
MRVAQVNHPHHSRTAFRILSGWEHPTRTIPQALRWQAGLLSAGVLLLVSRPADRPFRREDSEINLQVCVDSLWYSDIWCEQSMLFRRLTGYHHPEIFTLNSSFVLIESAENYWKLNVKTCTNSIKFLVHASKNEIRWVTTERGVSCVRCIVRYI